MSNKNTGTLEAQVKDLSELAKRQSVEIKGLTMLANEMATVLAFLVKERSGGVFTISTEMLDRLRRSGAYQLDRRMSEDQTSITYCVGRPAQEVAEQSLVVSPNAPRILMPQD